MSLLNLVQFLGFLLNDTSQDSSGPVSPILPLRPVEGESKGQGNALILEKSQSYPTVPELCALGVIASPAFPKRTRCS